MEKFTKINSDYKGLEINDKAPDFVLKDINGNLVKLSSLLGKGNILLVFYRGGWCPKCNIQIASFSKDYEKFNQMKTGIVAISSDNANEAEKTEQQAKPKFPILLDTNSKVIESYGVLVEKRELKDMPALMYKKKKYAMPSVFILDKKGIVRYKYIGKSYTDRPDNEDLLKEIKKWEK